MIRFRRHPRNPIVRRRPDSFYSLYAANPDLLWFNNCWFFYFRGQDETGHDQIGVATADSDHFDGVNWQDHSGNPVIRVSDQAADFDSGHILDPAAIEIDGRVHLYYTAHAADWKTGGRPSGTGLAVSEDGFRFVKVGNRPLVYGTSPEIVAHQGTYFLFYQKLNRDGAFDIYCCPSSDGLRFDQQKEKIVFRPSGQAGAFDRFSISTVRIWFEKPWFYLFYGGCDRYYDYPRAIGLARSNDLTNWERYPGNPILERGRPGSWDEGALWFATTARIGKRYYLWYEGTGSGAGRTTTTARAVSDQVRREDYGGYGVTNFSQIGLATFSGSLDPW
ncbi:hypothetical protein JW992_06210 [candidate division KSB1 bacterium]|nr:hypothetical protein [candidate division KSB1 bacterium]